MKKLSLLIALLGICVGSAFASHTKWMLGTYQSSSEDAAGCHICCSSSSLYCYQMSVASQSNEQPTYYAFGEWQGPGQSYFGSYMTVTTYDSYQNEGPVYTGYYYGMNVQSNADGTKTANIALTKYPQN